MFEGEWDGWMPVLCGSLRERGAVEWACLVAASSFVWAMVSGVWRWCAVVGSAVRVGLCGGLFGVGVVLKICRGVSFFLGIYVSMYFERMHGLKVFLA